MTTFRAQIKNVVAGDDLEVRRTVKNIPTGQALSKAWFTMKANKDDTDLTAIFQKSITGTPTTSGEIEDDGTGDGVGVIVFQLAAADTLLCTPEQTYYYDIQVKTDAGRLYTLEVGTARFKQGVTEATT